MLNKLKSKFTSDFLLSPLGNTKFDNWYLVFGIMLFVAPFVLKIYLKTNPRPRAVYGTVDRVWFWGFLTSAVLTVFVWFARVQRLPLFGTRLASYLVLLIMLPVGLYVLWFYKKRLPALLNKHYEVTRKKKYIQPIKR